MVNIWPQHDESHSVADVLVRCGSFRMPSIACPITVNSSMLLMVQHWINLGSPVVTSKLSQSRKRTQYRTESRLADVIHPTLIDRYQGGFPIYCFPLPILILMDSNK